MSAIAIRSSGVPRMMASTTCAALLVSSGAFASEGGASIEPPSVAPRFIARSDAKLRRPVRRIVSTAPSATELLFALGHGDRLVGVSRYDVEPESVLHLPKVGGFLDPNVEAIVGLEPDLVIGLPSSGNRGALERIASFGIPTLVIPGNTFSDLFHAIDAVASALGPDARAAGSRLRSAILDELDRLSSLVREAPRVRVAVVYGWNPLSVGGLGSFPDTLLRRLGADNVVTEGPPYPQLAIERFLELGPDVVLDATADSGMNQERPSWMNKAMIPAVRNDRVHVVRLAGMLRPGPRVIEGMKKLTALLHPEVVAREAVPDHGASRTSK